MTREEEEAEHGRVLRENVELRVALFHARTALEDRRVEWRQDLINARTALESAMEVIAQRTKERDEMMVLVKRYEVMVEEGFRRPRLVATL
jgi:hypothetical protein